MQQLVQFVRSVQQSISGRGVSLTLAAGAALLPLAYAAAFGLETLCLRYFNVFGPYQDPNGAYAAVIPAFVSRLCAVSIQAQAGGFEVCGVVASTGTPGVPPAT